MRAPVAYTFMHSIVICFCSLSTPFAPMAARRQRYFFDGRGTPWPHKLRYVRKSRHLLTLTQGVISSSLFSLRSALSIKTSILKTEQDKQSTRCTCAAQVQCKIGDITIHGVNRRWVIGPIALKDARDERTQRKTWGGN